MATLARFQESIIDGDGNALTTGVTCEVRASPGGALASLFSDRAGVSGISNPVAGDSEGMVAFFVEPGVYDITVNHVSFGSRSYTYRVLEAVPHGAGDVGGVIAINIGSGTQADFDPSLVEGVGFLELNPNAGNTDLHSLVWDDYPDGAELVVTNVHATNVVSLINGGSSTTGKVFRGYTHLTLLQFMSCKIKKSSILDKWIILP